MTPPTITPPTSSSSELPQPKLSQPSVWTLPLRPQPFYERLAQWPAQPGRYWWLLLLTGLVAGVAAATTGRATVEAQARLGTAGFAPGVAYGTLVFSSLFLSVLSWALMWFLGNLGAGSKSRSAEVYGSSFVVQLIWGALLALLGLCIHPAVNVAVPALAGLSQEKAALAAQHYTQAVAAQVAAHPALRISNVVGYLVYLWQFWLAYVGLRRMTGQPRKAAAGVGYVVALFAVLVAVYYLLNAAVATLGTAAG